MNTDATDITYESTVRSFDHGALADLEGYARLREAMDAVAKTAKGVTLAEFLAAVQDMALTAPYADTCDCATADANYGATWPHKVDRAGDWLTCAYRCGRCGREWTCGYTVRLMDWM